jgi:putative glycerol-1-phosphate prenyltransferase
MMYATLKHARSTGQKQLAVLIDPDKTNRDTLMHLASLAEVFPIGCFLWGGSLVSETQNEYYLSLLKAHTSKPVVLFPGSMYQINPKADAILLLSLISGRNPDLLIGQHVLAAAKLKHSNLEIIPTGYMLVDGGHPTSVSYISNTLPIPSDKPDIARITALAGTLLGLQLIYLDSGSGARYPVKPEMIAAVRSEVNVPIVVGGGIRSSETARQALQAGADMIVVGNALEKNIDWLPELCATVQSVSLAQTSPSVSNK